MLPPELLTPGNLLLTSFTGLGLALGAAIVYVRKNLMTPTQAKATDLVIAGGSFFDTAKLEELKTDVKRIAMALEEMVKLRREQMQEEEMEERMGRLLDQMIKRMNIKP